MLPRSSRLHKSEEIRTILRRGQRLPTPYVYVYYLPRSDHKGLSRVACIVSKKVHSSAIKRHYYQRWLREAARHFIPRIVQTCDMVWVAKPAITKVKNLTELQDNLTPYLQKLS